MFRLSSYSVAKRLGLLIASAIAGLAILLVFFMVTERTMLMQGFPCEPRRFWR